MGKLIHHTVTITITETWTITWTEEAPVDDEPQPQATTIVQGQPQPQEEPDETLQSTLSDTDPGLASPAPAIPRHHPHLMASPPCQAGNANAPVVAVAPDNQCST